MEIPRGAFTRTAGYFSVNRDLGLELPVSAFHNSFRRGGRMKSGIIALIMIFAAAVFGHTAEDAKTCSLAQAKELYVGTKRLEAQVAVDSDKMVYAALAMMRAMSRSCYAQAIGKKISVPGTGAPGADSTCKWIDGTFCMDDENVLVHYWEPAGICDESYRYIYAGRCHAEPEASRVAGVDGFCFDAAAEPFCNESNGNLTTWVCRKNKDKKSCERSEPSKGDWVNQNDGCYHKVVGKCVTVAAAAEAAKAEKARAEVTAAAAYSGSNGDSGGPGDGGGSGGGGTGQ
jgi:hypothetical protein